MSNVQRLEPSADASRSVDETDTVDVSAPSSVPQARGTAAAGPTVSRYVVLEELGRGGMGRVLRAYDPKLQREVALKEVRRDRLDEEATTRLVAEARAMAKLSHPNVVAVYDAEEVGCDEVVLVMEYVAGQTLKAWLREENRSRQDIVERFLAAGRGLSAAHESGLLHRDFKPANVLINARGDVKVTDFGLAKASLSASERSSSEHDASSEELTEAGTVLGTPRYMAPEQHRPGRSGSDRLLTPAADQYAFCVALWEALTRKPPFAGKEMVEAKEAGPPRWPVPSVPRPLVDAIVRGLSPRPDDRWPSMEALLEALAYDPSRRRNRWLLGLGGVGVMTMAGVSYEAWAQARAQRCSGAQQQLAGIWDEAREDAVKTAMLGIDQPYAQPAWERTRAQLQQYAADWAAMHTEACEATTIRGEQSPQMMDLRMACLHRAAVELEATTEVLADADETVVQKAHELTGGLPSLSRCADTEALAAGVEPPTPDEAPDVEAARERLAQARTLSKAGRYEAAKRAVDQADALLEEVEYGPVQTEVALVQGDVLDRLGRYEASEAALESALQQAATWRQGKAMRQAALELMFVVGVRQRRMEDALRYRPLAEGLSRGDPESEGSPHTNLGGVLYAQGKYGEAEAEYRAALALREKALGPDHPDVAVSRNNLALVLNDQGKYEEAETEHRAALALLEKALGPDHPHLAGARNNLANVLADQGKYAQAETEYRAARALLEKALGPDHPDVASSRNNLGTVLNDQGKYKEAETEHRAALALREKALGPEHPHLAQSRSHLAKTLLALDRPAEALPLAEQAWTRRQRDDIPAEQRAETAFVLARILWVVEAPARDRSRARALAEDAVRSYRDAGAAHAEDAQRAQQWLDAHPLR